MVWCGVVWVSSCEGYALGVVFGVFHIVFYWGWFNGICIYMDVIGVCMDLYRCYKNLIAHINVARVRFHVGFLPT